MTTKKIINYFERRIAEGGVLTFERSRYRTGGRWEGWKYVAAFSPDPYSPVITSRGGATLLAALKALSKALEPRKTTRQLTNINRVRRISRRKLFNGRPRYYGTTDESTPPLAPLEECHNDPIF